MFEEEEKDWIDRWMDGSHRKALMPDSSYRQSTTTYYHDISCVLLEYKNIFWHIKCLKKLEIG